MIYTVTLNPAIDLVIVTKQLKAKAVNRTESFELQPNGKGVNVSFILKKLGVPNVATGIGGGATLDYVTSGLKKKGIATKFLRVEEPTRVNVFTRVLDEKTEYKEVNPGPKISQEVQDKFLKMLEKSLNPEDVLVISGSFSQGIEPNYLVTLAKLANQKQAKLVIDNSDLAVLDTLPYHPFLLKPNEDELASFFAFSGEMTLKKTHELANKLVEQGCQHVLVSLGERGAMLVSQDSVYLANAPKINVLNTAGAGDTMLGSFLGQLVKGKSLAEALKLSVAAGSDTASRTGLTDFNLDKLLKEIIVKEGI